MVYTLLMPYLDYIDLVHFCRLNSHCLAILNPRDGKSIHFDVLFEMQNRGFNQETMNLFKK